MDSVEVDHTFGRRAEQLMAENRLDEAFDLLEAGISKFPEYPAGYQLLGDLHKLRGNNISATFAYFEALKRDPENPLTMMKLGDVFRSEGQLREAQKYYQSAAKLDPDSEALRERLGEPSKIDDIKANAAFMTETAADLYMQQGHTDKAKAIYLHLIKQHPDDKKLLEKLEGCDG